MRRPVVAVLVLALVAAAAAAWLRPEIGAAGPSRALDRLAALFGIALGPPRGFSGYVDADYVWVAPIYGGTLTTLSVARGDFVEAGAPLFALDPEPERTTRTEAEARLAQAEATVRNLETGRRPDEIAAVAAQRAQAAAALRHSEAELRRQMKLRASGASSQSQLDAARSARDRDRARVAELDAQLRIARLPARQQEIRAARAAVAAARAALATATWRLAQKTVRAPAAGLVVDTLYRPGEPVPAAAPVVQLLPPGNLKLRFFVPEPALARLRIGDRLAVSCDGCAAGLAATVRYIAPAAEYTPPVIYSREERVRLVFMAEATPDAAAAATLHPGLPVEVTPLAPETAR